MKKYYLHNGQARIGPFDMADLKEHQVTESTPVWFDGQQEWIPAGQVGELQPLFEVPTAKNAAMAEEALHDKNIIGRRLISILNVIILVLAAACIFLLWQQQNRKNAEAHLKEAQEEEKARVRASISSYVTASHSEYNYSATSGISGLDITVLNSTAYLLDNVRVAINYLTANGKIWKTVYLDFNNMQPFSRMALAAPNSDSGVSVQHKIVSVTSTALGLP